MNPQCQSPNPCPLCGEIPDYKFVETLHTSERLPEQVDDLEVLGGYGLYGAEQVRKCPACGAYFSFLHDHDSQSGVGYGYTDESITRLTLEEALEVIERTLRSTSEAIVYWQEQGDADPDERPDFLSIHRQELVLLERERRSLLEQLKPGSVTPNL